MARGYMPRFVTRAFFVMSLLFFLRRHYIHYARARGVFTPAPLRHDITAGTAVFAMLQRVSFFLSFYAEGI